MMNEYVVGGADPATRFFAEFTHGGAEVKDPNGAANGHMVIFLKLHADILYRHCPAVHSVAAAPPEAESAARSLGSTHFIYLRARSIRRLKSLLFGIAHSGEINDELCRVGADVGVIALADGEMLLVIKYNGHIARYRLYKSEDEVGGGHEIQREHIELDAYPEHQRYTEYSAEHRAYAFIRYQQPRRRQI